MAMKALNTAVQSQGWFLSNPHGSEPRSYSEISDGVDVIELMDNLRDWVDAEERSFNLNSLIFIEYDNY